MTSKPAGPNTLAVDATDLTSPPPIEQRVTLTYTCDNGHETRVSFWRNAEVPITWQCRTCSRFAALPGVDAPVGPWRAPSLPDWEPKSHIDQLHERRTEEELEALLAERLEFVRARRKAA